MNCTLLVDGNWLFRSRIFSVKEHFVTGLDDYSYGNKVLRQLLAQSICGMLNKLEIVDNVIVVADKGSWRKKLAKPKAYEEDAYKGNRKLESDSNWDELWSCYDYWLEDLQKMGINVSRNWDLEGDDWICYWSKTLDSDVIIWSTDHDLQQLVSYENGRFVAWYEKTQCCILPKSADRSNMDMADFCLAPPESGNLLWLKSALNPEYIEPFDIVMDKVIKGDAGDNIKSIIRIPKNGKIFKVAPKDWEKCKETVGVTKDNFWEKKTEIVDYLLTLKKYANYDRFDALDMFDFNKKLVVLDLDTIPNNLFEGATYNNTDVDLYRNNYELLGCIQEVDNNPVNNVDLPF